MVDPPSVEARPPGALRCGRRRCSLGAARRSSFCIVIRSLVAIASSNEAFNYPVLAPALKLKRTNQKKVTKRTGTLDLKHREAGSCGKEERGGSRCRCSRQEQVFESTCCCILLPAPITQVRFLSVRLSQC